MMQRGPARLQHPVTQAGFLKLTQDSNVGKAWCVFAKCVWEILGSHTAGDSLLLQ